MGQVSLRLSDNDSAALSHSDNMNASVASIEEIMDVVGASPSVAPAPYLNCKVPTSQQELMLH